MGGGTDKGDLAKCHCRPRGDIPLAINRPEGRLEGLEGLKRQVKETS